LWATVLKSAAEIFEEGVLGYQSRWSEVLEGESGERGRSASDKNPSKEEIAKAGLGRARR